MPTKVSSKNKPKNQFIKNLNKFFKINKPQSFLSQRKRHTRGFHCGKEKDG
jgi:hypothetical protein